MKKVQKYFVFLLVFVVLFRMHSFALNNNNYTKRIVSVVYDDSWSMFSNKADYAYANYALQNIIAFMNENDELNIVKMSSKTEYNNVDLSTKESKMKNILDTEKWPDRADETPFEAVVTAIESLKDKKAIYGNSENIEYWLLVLTDGGFEGMPEDINGYLQSVNDYMSDVKFESIWVFVGSLGGYISMPKVLSDFNNATSIKSNNKEAICDGLFKAVEKIYGRTSIKGNDIKANNNTITINYSYPINKILIYEQDQTLSIKDLITEDGSSYKEKVIYATSMTNEDGSIKLNSNIIEINGDSNSIPSGKIEIQFDGEVDTSENKLQIIVEPAIGLDLYAVDNAGDRIENMNILQPEDLVDFVVEPINIYTNEKIDLSNNIGKINAKYICDGDKNNLIFDTNTKNFKFNRIVNIGHNNLTATAELPGYFDVKSNILSIYIPPTPRHVIPKLENDSFQISNTMSKDYQKVADTTYILENLPIKSNGNLDFSSIPKGIQIKVNETVVKNNKVALSLNEKNNIEIYRNKDYKDNDKKTITINVEFNDKKLNLRDKGVSFTLEPINRVFDAKVEELFENKNHLDTANAYNTNLYKIIPTIDGKNISKEELKQSKIYFENLNDKVKWKYKIVEEHNENVIYLSISKPFIPLKEKNVDTKFIITTPFGDEIIKNLTFDIEFNIQNSVLTILIILMILIWVIGIIKKPKFDTKNHKFIIARNGKEEYNGPISIDNRFLQNIIPFKAQNGRVSDLKLKASQSKNQIIVDKKSLNDNMQYDSDDVDPHKDLVMYEDTLLRYKEKGNTILYTYHNVLNDIEDEETNSSSKRRRRIR